MELPRIALTVTEFAKAIGVSKSTAYSLIREGKVLARKVRRRTLVFLSDNESWFDRFPFKTWGDR